MSHRTLKDCCSFQEGYVNPSKKDGSYFGGDIKWLRASDLNNGHVYDTEAKLSEKGFLSAGKSAKMFKPGSLAISKSGTIGRLGILEDEMCGNRAVINIEVNQDLAELKYVFYTLKYKIEELKSRAGGSIQKNLYVSSLETLTLNHGELNDQRRISKILSDLDAKIELNNKINAELEAMAKLIYDYWFVQFDFPDNNGKPYKSSGGKMVYNEELKREIPEGWIVGGFANIGDIVGGTTPSKAKGENFVADGSGTPWITPKDLSLNTDKKFITRGEFDVTEAGIRDGSLKIMPKGTILLTSRAPIGYIAISRDPVTTNQGFKSIVPNERFSTEFVFHTTALYVDAMKQYASGSTFSEISATVLKMIRIPLPPEMLVHSYTGKVQTLFNEQNNLELQNKKLAELRDWLLPMLMNGQVKVQ